MKLNTYPVQGMNQVIVDLDFYPVTSYVYMGRTVAGTLVVTRIDNCEFPAVQDTIRVVTRELLEYSYINGRLHRCYKRVGHA